MHVVMFSGGAASSVVAKMVAERNPGQTVLLHTPTGAEHEDADRFREEVASHIGLPIYYESAKKSLWEMVESNKHIPNDSLPWCTERLKLIPQERYLKRLEEAGEKFVIYVGIGADEWRRAQKIIARSEIVGRKVRFPLLDKFLTGDDCKRIVREEMKICLPQPYLYLEHNNCIPCYKGGKGHWFKVWKYYPDRFYRAAKAEERAENQVFEDISLMELAGIWKSYPPQEEMFSNYLPCMCAM